LTLSSFVSPAVFSYCYVYPRDLHSFPTRRSSDLSQLLIAYFHRAKARRNSFLENIRHPASSIQHPTSSIQHPTSSIQHPASSIRSEEHTSELQSRENLVCRLLLEKKKKHKTKKKT